MDVGADEIRPGRIAALVALLCIGCGAADELPESDDGACVREADPPFDPALAPEPEVLRTGERIRVLRTNGHYVNDHSIVRAADGTWHLFGIYAVQPRPEGQPEVDFVHAIATEPDPTRWTAESFELAPSGKEIALRAQSALGEEHIWAPHVVQDGGDYRMFFHAGGLDGSAQMRSARSSNLFDWEREPKEALFRDICVARDPMLLRFEDRWLLYYTRCNDDCHRRSGVAVRTSTDLVHWSEPSMALALAWSTPMFNSGFAESPFVFRRGAHWYMSVTSYPVSWARTYLFRSDSPLHFDDEPIAQLDAHAAEWIVDSDDETAPVFATHAGPGQEGVWLMQIQSAPLGSNLREGSHHVDEPDTQERDARARRARGTEDARGQWAPR